MRLCTNKHRLSSGAKGVSKREASFKKLCRRGRVARFSQFEFAPEEKNESIHIKRRPHRHEPKLTLTAPVCQPNGSSHRRADLPFGEDAACRSHAGTLSWAGYHDGWKSKLRQCSAAERRLPTSRLHSQSYEHGSMGNVEHSSRRQWLDSGPAARARKTPPYSFTK